MTARRNVIPARRHDDDGMGELFSCLSLAHFFFGFGYCLSEDVKPVFGNDVADVEEHEAVALFEVHLHSALEAVRIAIILLNIHAAIERTVTEKFAREFACSFHTEVVTGRPLAVGLVFNAATASVKFVESYVNIVVTVGVEIEKLVERIVFVFGSSPIEILGRIVILARPINAHFVVRGIPCTGVVAEHHVRLGCLDGFTSALEEIIDD